MFESPHIYFRADAGVSIGSGHFMRCLAFAQFWKKCGGTAIFVSKDLAPALAERLLAEGIGHLPIASEPGSPEDTRETVGAAKAVGNAWLVLDGYHFGAEYQLALRAASLRFLALDDYGHSASYHADFVLNQNVAAEPGLYAHKDAGCRLLLGPPYVLLRSEFLSFRKPETPTPPVARRILVTLGGSDPANVSLRALRAIGQAGIDGAEVTVVVGPNSPHRAALEIEAALAGFRVTLLSNPPSMPELIAAADLVVCAGGSTAWEVAFLGAPSLMVCLAPNQQGNVDRLDELGCAVALRAEESDGAWAERIAALARDPALRRAISWKGRALIDGQGCLRVWLQLQSRLARLREATLEDARLLWNWSNAPQVRAQSFSSGPIPWETHVEWLRAKLASPNSPFWVLETDSGNPIGQARFEIEGRGAIISLSLDADWSGKNYGTLLIALAARKLFAEGGVDTIEAQIKPDNTGSIRAFAKAGFSRQSPRLVRGHASEIWSLRREAAEGFMLGTPAKG